MWECSLERQCYYWFAKLCSGDFSLKNAQQSVRPVKVDDTHIKAFINLDAHSTRRENAEKLNVLHSCIKKNQFDYIKKHDL